MGGNAPLIDPQSGSRIRSRRHGLASTGDRDAAVGGQPQMADTAVENYWMALCRDINFTQYGQEPLTTAAIAELNSLPAFHGPNR